MPTGKELAQAVYELATTIVSYETGKSGQNGRCDCVGLIMGAMNTLERVNYPIHSSNYFARLQMQYMREMDKNAMEEGMLVYKARKDKGELNDRYKEGGRYYTGDLLDYYHIGAVTGVDPLEITHCTSSTTANGIVRDKSTKGWTHYGAMNKVTYTAAGGGMEEPMGYKAKVVAKTGSTVNLRKRPDDDAPIIKRVPLGEIVTVNEEAEGWAQVAEPTGEIGYMMTKFLAKVEEAETGENVPETPSEPTFEEAVLSRLDRIIELLMGENEGVG